jgi:CheY-like chemotaxis protein
VLRVIDTGEGLSEEARAHLFEPFYSTKQAGIGLGLATVKQSVDQHDGVVQVESVSGEGSTFSVYLPRLLVETADDRSSSDQMHAPGGDEVLLVVEDEPLVRTTLVRMLELLGYQVLQADHGEEALRVAADHSGPIHLLVSDVVMPVMGGPELAKRLRAQRPELRVLFVSGYPAGDPLTEHDLGFPILFLAKPFSPSRLARRVRTALDRR